MRTASITYPAFIRLSCYYVHLYVSALPLLSAGQYNDNSRNEKNTCSFIWSFRFFLLKVSMRFVEKKRGHTLGMYSTYVCCLPLGQALSATAQLNECVSLFQSWHFVCRPFLSSRFNQSFTRYVFGVEDRRLDQCVTFIMMKFRQSALGLAPRAGRSPVGGSSPPPSESSGSSSSPLVTDRETAISLQAYWRQQIQSRSDERRRLDGSHLLDSPPPPALGPPVFHEGSELEEEQFMYSTVIT